jgi:hypothetical protein
VWKALTNCAGWRENPALVEWFGRVEWFEGVPWRVGSRILIEHTWPSPAEVRMVIVSITPPEEFSWIGHARGLTAHQQVRIEASGPHESVLLSTMNYAAPADEMEAATVDSVSDRLLRTFLDAIADQSERGRRNIQKAG